jgi:hypothetical protein
MGPFTATAPQAKAKSNETQRVSPNRRRAEVSTGAPLYQPAVRPGLVREPDVLTRPSGERSTAHSRSLTQRNGRTLLLAEGWNQQAPTGLIAWDVNPAFVPPSLAALRAHDGEAHSGGARRAGTSAP